MFESIMIDAKFEDIQDCIDPLKYIFPSNCKIKISLLEEKEEKCLNEEKRLKDVQDAHGNGSIIDQEKELEINRQNFSRRTEEDEEKKSKISSTQKVKNTVKLKKKYKTEEKKGKAQGGEKDGQLEQKDAKNEFLEKGVYQPPGIADESDIVNEIIRILEEGKKRGLNEYLHISPDPYGKMARNAWKRCKIPEGKDEGIIGILDLTISGSAKNCLVFGKHGIYFRNPRLTKGKLSGKIEYRDIGNINLYVADEGNYNLKLGDENILNVRILGGFDKQINCLKDILCKIFALARNYIRKNGMKGETDGGW